MTRWGVFLVTILAAGCAGQPMSMSVGGDRPRATEKQAPESDRETLASTAAPSGETDAERRARIEKEMCEATVCQRDLHVRLTRKDGSVFEKTYPVFPGIIQPMGITVVANQEVFVEARVEGDRLTDLEAVDEITHPDRTIVVRFEQQDDASMILTLENPFDRTLKFNMGIMPLAEDRLLKTSSCPVQPGLTLYEHWPYPIFQVLLGNPHFLASDAKMMCEF